MLSNEIREKLQNIVRGTCVAEPADRCSSIRNLLIEGFGADPTVKSQFEDRAIIKEKQADFLRSHAKRTGLWMDSLPAGVEYLTRGGEAQIYLHPDNLNIIKINDGIYYATWLEYFTSLVIHNTLFPQTAYSLMGFLEDAGQLYVTVRQPYIEGEQARLDDINELLIFNGFVNTRRQDYYNKEFGLVLEDMHDENVISRQDILFFIDTVFYIMP